MEMKSRIELLDSLARFGYPLLQPDIKADPHELLSALIDSGDSRLLEGFPIVLANCSARKDSGLALDKAARLVTKPRSRAVFWQMVSLSNMLFDMVGLGSLRFKLESKENDRQRKSSHGLRNSLMHDRHLKLGNVSLDPRRLKKTFLDYVVSNRIGQRMADEDKSKLNEEFKQEYHLSLLLSPRQKDILHKRLRGEKMTKTEREYFSRVIRKRLVAMADPDIHHLAQKALR